ncbi:hypothetical protein SARC_17944 [Sphaeroforma arctica JP610]|uniref:Uncharacterized protein n=1 Tax=Sphaeroforma arctica JP610 TaxID=667725 RepID=A0A0L0EYR6_9EUKA|nr:hypothetical protein SARC_17944 [Sphaeroforma arctica JP610]KNC69544.1 hypothetical protein SARC_17944 [Sphaeroforma arctica JP610]|eukprot:XP_014143446.1 hypothetical protein SARC_17944 [Sphaeroforma arctica JP610]
MLDSAILYSSTHPDIHHTHAHAQYCGEFDAMAFCMISDWALDTAATGEKYGMDPLTMIFAGVFYFAVPVILTLNFMGVYYGGDMKPGNVGVNTRTDIRQKKMN